MTMKKQIIDFYCTDDLQIRNLADQIWNGHPDDVDFVRATFDYVRDKIHYSWMMDWTVPAVTTLKTRKGNCFNKAALLWSILQKGDIAARFLIAIIPVEGEIVARMAPDWAWKHFPSQHSPHAVVEVFLRDKWLILDPTVDSELARGMLHFGNPAASFQFDGAHDAISPLFRTLGPKKYDKIDCLLTKKPSYSKGLVVLMESSVYFLRTHGMLFATPQELQQALEAYLFTRCPEIVSSSPSIPPSFPGITTKFCDPYHPQIQQLATRFRTKTSSDAEFAIAAFGWVRDNILYTLQTDWNVPVEHTLAIRQGMCSTKACVLTSILKAGGLEAGFFMKRQDARREFIGPPWILRHYQKQSAHFLSGVRLHGNWIKLDPFIDGALASSMADADLTRSRSNFFVEFDGHNHALPCPDSQMAFMHNIDSFMSKKSQVPTAVIRCHNICLELLRKLGSMFSGADSVIQAMEDHLATFHPHLVKEAMASAVANSKKNSFSGDLLMVSVRHSRQRLSKL